LIDFVRSFITESSLFEQCEPNDDMSQKGGAVVSSAAFVDAVARMVHRVDLTEGHEGGGGDTVNTTAARRRSSKNDTDPTRVGPLTRPELAELSFLCTAAAQAAVSASSVPPTKDSKKDCAAGFAAVEGDQLIGLMELLDRHVALAVSVNLMESAVAVVAASSHEELSPSQAAAAMDQV
jgi:hypothetical protein